MRGNQRIHGLPRHDILGELHSHDCWMFHLRAPQGSAMPVAGCDDYNDHSSYLRRRSFLYCRWSREVNAIGTDLHLYLTQNLVPNRTHPQERKLDFAGLTGLLLASCN